MLIDYITIDNIFDDPNQLVEYARQQTYYSLKDHPLDKGGKVTWAGRRTDSLNKIDPELVRKLSGSIGYKLMLQGVAEGITNWDYRLMIDMYFHYLTDEDIYSKAWLHRDSGQLLAGVVYLDTNAKVDSGTIVFRGNEKIIVSNEFNKLVLYRSDYVHSAEGGYGHDQTDGRLTLTFFIKQLQVFAGSTDIAGLV
jgi:hypothetical protein